jgi:iron complex outermembrane receptor protein
LAVTHQAYAQEVDYGSLEQIFGEPVTTSATGSPQKASQVPANMEIITAETIRRSGATNIPEILRFVAGIDVRNYGALDSDVSIRGYSQAFNPRLLVLINGRQVYLDDYSYVAWQSLPVQLINIRQIEIVKGPASALFGFNAVAGVINIITFDPLEDKTNTISLGTGSDGTLIGSLVSTLNDPGKGGVTVSLGGLRTREYSVDTLTPANGPYYTTPHNGSYSIDGRYKPTPLTELTLELTGSNANANTENSSYFYDGTEERDQSIKTSVAIDSSLGIITVLGYINNTKTRFYQINNVGLNTDLSNQVDVLQVNDLFETRNNHAFRIAFEYRDNRGFGSIFSGTIGYTDYAASVMWRWHITPQLALTSAVRVDHLLLMRNDPLPTLDRFTLADFNRVTTAPSFNIGLVYEPNDTDTFRWLIGRAFQAPSLFDYGLTSQFALAGRIILLAGNPELNPTASTNYEMDYDKSMSGVPVLLRTAIFYNTTVDLLGAPSITPYVAWNNMLQSYGANVGHSSAYGAEIGLRNANPTGFRWNISYALVKVEDKTSSVPPASALQFNNSTPESAINAGLGYTWHKWEADLQGKWQSAYNDYTLISGIGWQMHLPVSVPNYVMVNGRLGYQLTPQLTLAISGQQLQAAQTVETAGTEPERRILFSASYEF